MSTDRQGDRENSQSDLNNTNASQTYPNKVSSAKGEVTQRSSSMASLPPTTYQTEPVVDDDMFKPKRRNTLAIAMAATAGVVVLFGFGVYMSQRSATSEDVAAGAAVSQGLVVEDKLVLDMVRRGGTIDGAGTFDFMSAIDSLNASQRAAEPCWQDADQGSAQVAVTFAPDGTVAQATLAEPKGASDAVRQCVERNFRDARATKYEGKNVTIQKRYKIERP